MRKLARLLPHLIIASLLLFSFSKQVFGDQLDDINKQINDLTAAYNQSKAATAPLEAQLNDIKARVKFIEADLFRKKGEIDDGYKNLEKQTIVLNAAIRDFYIKSYYNNPLVILISATRASDITQALGYQKATADHDKAIITNIAITIQDLEIKQKNLEEEQAKLAVTKAKLDKIVGDAKAYQNSLSVQIAALTAQQQAIIAAKQSALASATGVSLDTQNTSSACPTQPLSSYPSTIRVKFPDGHVENMPFEDQYLKGLGEMPRAWESVNNHVEAFKAQVVAARTYALYKMVRSSCRDFDVYSTTADQVYSGGTSDGDWNSAVSATRGQFLQNGGNTIIAYYSANSGGHTLSPQQAWNGGGGYPSGVSDMGNDGKPNGDLNARCIGTLRWEYHYNIGREGKIQYNDTCPGGDINNNNSPMSSSELEDIIDATTWTIRNGHVPDNSMSHDQIKNAIGGDAIGAIQSVTANVNDTYTSTLNVVGSNRTIPDLDAQTFRLVFNIRSPGQFLMPSTTYGARFVRFDVLTSDQAHGTQGSGWYFYTYGYGHRIGLDQEGALGMASQGGDYGSYTNILSHYYQGTTLTSNGYSGSVQ